MYTTIHWSIYVDKLNALGSSSLGNVIMAHVKKEGRLIPVAAKTLRSTETQDGTAVRSLLMEIKVSSYLGKHLNITQLVGAYTAEANLGKVYAFFELCSHGSLQNYLRKQMCGSHENPNEAQMPAGDLYRKWAKDIAEGMDYIASKFIVHADLATRNVLQDGCKNL